MSKIEGKAEISDLPDSKWQSDHALWWFLERKCNGRTWQTEQCQLCSSNSHSCFHHTAANCALWEERIWAKAETWDVSWLPSVIKWLWSSPAWFLCLQTSFQVKLQLTPESLFHSLFHELTALPITTAWTGLSAVLEPQNDYPAFTTCQVTKALREQMTQ